MKAFLERNKIFFETFAATFLGIMGIFVSISQTTLASHSNEIAKIPYLPQIISRLKSEGSACGPKSWELITSNISGNAYDVQVNPIAFLNIRELQLLNLGEKPKQNAHLKSATIPLEGYFLPIAYGTSDTKGKLVVQCTDNPSKMDMSEREFDSIYESKMHNSITHDTIIYIMVKYKDRFRNSHTKFFKVDGSGQTVPVSPSLGRNEFNIYHNMINENKYLIYGKSTGIDIMDKWLSNAKYNHKSKPDLLFGPSL